MHSKFWGKVGANGGQVGENKRTQLPFSKSIAKYYQFSMECTIDGGVHHSRGALHHFECTTKVECTKIVRHRWRTAPFSSAPRKWMTRSTVSAARGRFYIFKLGSFHCLERLLWLFSSFYSAAKFETGFKETGCSFPT